MVMLPMMTTNNDYHDDDDDDDFVKSRAGERTGAPGIPRSLEGAARGQGFFICFILRTRAGSGPGAQSTQDDSDAVSRAEGHYALAMARGGAASAASLHSVALTAAENVSPPASGEKTTFGGAGGDSH
ncbi:unnamed protein product [Lampetra fluviatilis]